MHIFGFFPILNFAIGDFLAKPGFHQKKGPASQYLWKFIFFGNRNFHRHLYQNLAYYFAVWKDFEDIKLLEWFYWKCLKLYDGMLRSQSKGRMKRRIKLLVICMYACTLLYILVISKWRSRWLNFQVVVSWKMWIWGWYYMVLSHGCDMVHHSTK